jgi:hypothetical protein
MRSDLDDLAAQESALAEATAELKQVQGQADHWDAVEAAAGCGL